MFWKPIVHIYQAYLKGKLDGGIQEFISLGVLRELDVPLPSIKEEQTAIAQLLSDMDAEIEQLEHWQYSS